MKKNLVFEIYAYIMLGACLIIGGGSLTSVIEYLIGYSAPETALSENQVLKYGHNDNYRKTMSEYIEFESDEQVTNSRAEAREVAIRAAKHGALANLKAYVPVTLLFLLLAGVHGVLAARCRRGCQNKKAT